MLASESSCSLSKIETSAVFQRLRTASLVICTLAATSFAAPPTTEASILTFDAVLLGSSENPPHVTAGTGFAEVTFDTVAHLMRVQVDFSGLTSNNTASHIHCCVDAPGNAGVATTTPTFTSFPGGVTSGSYDHTFNMSDASSYNPAFVTALGSVANAETALLNGLIAGQAYLNIHTPNFPGGEIRGFLVETPLPAALPLFATGLGALGLLGWRRKRKAAA